MPHKTLLQKKLHTMTRTNNSNHDTTRTAHATQRRRTQLSGFWRRRCAAGQWVRPALAGRRRRAASRGAVAAGPTQDHDGVAAGSLATAAETLPAQARCQGELAARPAATAAETLPTRRAWDHDRVAASSLATAAETLPAQARCQGRLAARPAATAAGTLPTRRTQCQGGVAAGVAATVAEILGVHMPRWRNPVPEPLLRPAAGTPQRQARQWCGRGLATGASLPRHGAAAACHGGTWWTARQCAASVTKRSKAVRRAVQYPVPELYPCLHLPRYCINGEHAHSVRF